MIKGNFFLDTRTRGFSMYTDTNISNMNEFPSPTSLMTPNTIKTIEQSILASLEGSSAQSNIIPSTATGSFLPPLPQITVLDQNRWQGGQVNEMTESTSTSFITSEDDPDDEEDSDVDEKPPKNKKVKRTAGRKPRGTATPEEDERRKIRRERNKLAAARCRKRRVDQTNKLVNETENLEHTRSQLQSLISKLQQEKDDLEFILNAHIPSCNLDIKPVLTLISTPTTNTSSHSGLGFSNKRPTSLQILHTRRDNNNAGHGPITSLPMSITTPSHGLISFDNTIDWNDLPSTGLTPTNNNSLVTPLVTPSTANAILSSLNSKFVNL